MSPRPEVGEGAPPDQQPQEPNIQPQTQQGQNPIQQPPAAAAAQSALSGQSASQLQYGQTSVQPPSYSQTAGHPTQFGHTAAQPTQFGQTATQPTQFGQTAAQPTQFGQTAAQSTQFDQTASQSVQFGQTAGQPGPFGQPSSQFGETAITFDTTLKPNQSDGRDSFQIPAATDSNRGNAEQTVQEEITQQSTITTRGLQAEQLQDGAIIMDLLFMKSVPAVLKYFELVLSLLAFCIINGASEAAWMCWPITPSPELSALRFFKFVTITTYLCALTFLLFRMFRIHNQHWRLQLLPMEYVECGWLAIYTFLYLVSASVIASENRMRESYRCRGTSNFVGGVVFGFFTMIVLVIDTLYWTREILIKRGILTGQPGQPSNRYITEVDTPSIINQDMQPTIKNDFHTSQEDFHNPIHVVIDQAAVN